MWITSDRCFQFTQSVIVLLNGQPGIISQSNRLIERFHCSQKTHNAWFDQFGIPLTLQIASNARLDASPAVLTLHHSSIIPSKVAAQQPLRLPSLPTGLVLCHTSMVFPIHLWISFLGKWVFLLMNAHKSLLQLPYHGPDRGSTTWLMGHATPVMILLTAWSWH